MWVVTSDRELAACEVLSATRREDDATAWGAQSIAELLEMGRAGMRVRAAHGGGGTPPGGAPCGEGPRGRQPGANRALGSERDAAVEAFFAAAVALEDQLCKAECSEAWDECREVHAWLQSLPSARRRRWRRRRRCAGARAGGGGGRGAPAGEELAAAPRVDGEGSWLFDRTPGAITSESWTG